MKTSENNNQYLAKTVISARSQNVLTWVFYLYVFTRVCVLDHQNKEVAGQIMEIMKRFP
jgi:hypothetical protein